MSASDTYLKRTLVVLAAATVYRLIFIGFFGPGPDEAFYWEWSRRLSLGYVEHPPLVAWSIWLMRVLIGESAWAWRLLAVACATGAGWLLFCTGRVLFSPRVGMWAAVSHAVSPVLSGAGGTLIIPETLLIFWISLALYCSARLIKTDKQSWFYALGVVLGFGLLSKLPAIIIPAALGLFAILSPSHRRWFRSWPPYAMVLIAVLIMSPMIYWNATHDWIGLGFVGERTEIKEDAAEPGIGLLWQSLMSQAAYHSPVLYILLWFGALGMGYRGLVRKEPGPLLLFCYSAPVMILFQLVAATRFTLPHWPMAGYLAAYIAVPALIIETPKPARWKVAGFRVGLGIAAVFCLFIPVIMFYPLTTVAYARLQRYVGAPPQVIEPMAHAVGWQEEIRDGILAARARIAEQYGEEPVVLTHFHMLAGILAYGLRDDCPVLCVHAQAHQYDVWYGDQDLVDRPVLFVSSSAFLTSAGRPGEPQDYYKFEACTPQPSITVIRHGVQINEMHLWLCSGYQGPADTPGPRI